jgi:uncharacterized FlaG/YvyC family protein
MNVKPIDGAPPSLLDLPSPSPPQAAQTRQLSQAVRVLNASSVMPEDRELTLSLDPKTKIAVVKVIDSTTHEVLDQIPADYILRLTAFLQAQAAQEKTDQATLLQKKQP